MKTMIVTCVSCLLLTGGYITIKHRGEFEKLLSFTFTALPTDLELNANRKPNIDAETSLAPVETLPNPNNILPVDKAVAVAVPVENKLEVLSDNATDSSWTGNSMLAQATADAFAEANEQSKPGVAEKHPLVVQVPYMEAKGSDEKIVLEAGGRIRDMKRDSVSRGSYRQWH